MKIPMEEGRLGRGASLMSTRTCAPGGGEENKRKIKTDPHDVEELTSLSMRGEF